MSGPFDLADAPPSWWTLVCTYTTRVADEVFRLNTVSPPPPPRVWDDTSRIGWRIGRFGRFVSYFVPRSYAAARALPVPKAPDALAGCPSCGAGWRSTELTGEARHGGGYRVLCHGCGHRWDDRHASHGARETARRQEARR